MGFAANQSTVEIIGVPCDLGANIRGAMMGPASIRIAGLFHKLRAQGLILKDAGDIQVPIKGTFEEKNLVQQLAKICQSLKDATLRSFNNNHVPLILGGDHSVSIGSLAAYCQQYTPKKSGLIWIDTHADLNTPDSSPSGNIHGMPLSCALGTGYAPLISLFENKFLLPENVVLVGLRDIDKQEAILLKNSGVHYYTMRDIDEMGIQKVMNEIQSKLINQLDNIHVSFDMDVLDPNAVPGVSTPVPGGLTIREAHLALELLYESGKIVSADFVELNPFKDIKGQSAYIAVDFISSLFGKQIL